MSDKPAVKKGNYTLKVPKDRSQEEHFEIELRELDEPVFIAAQELLSNGKELECIRFLVRNLHVGGDSVEDFCNNFLAVRAATEPLIELIMPLKGELKKN